jgi:hypothetical protein
MCNRHDSPINIDREPKVVVLEAPWTVPKSKSRDKDEGLCFRHDSSSNRTLQLEQTV